MTQAESAEQAAIIAHVAEVYRNGAHTPDHPSYRAFLIETLNQWDELIADGWIFERTTTEPYPDSASMFQDMDKKRLLVYSGGQCFAEGHPLGIKVNVWTGRKFETWLYNEVFRAVHDVFGHGPTKCPFETFQGEVEATRNHQRKYSRDAWSALIGETYGQLCHYFAGLGFVDVQKAIVLDEELWP